jgi:hypothetical protein
MSISAARSFASADHDLDVAPLVKDDRVHRDSAVFDAELDRILCEGRAYVDPGRERSSNTTRTRVLLGMRP